MGSAHARSARLSLLSEAACHVLAFVSVLDVLVPYTRVRRRLADMRLLGNFVQPDPVVRAKKDPHHQHGAQEETDEGNEEGGVDSKRPAYSAYTETAGAEGDAMTLLLQEAEGGLTSVNGELTRADQAPAGSDGRRASGCLSSRLYVVCAHLIRQVVDEAGELRGGASSYAALSSHGSHVKDARVDLNVMIWAHMMTDMHMPMHIEVRRM